MVTVGPAALQKRCALSQINGGDETIDQVVHPTVFDRLLLKLIIVLRL